MISFCVACAMTFCVGPVDDEALMPVHNIQAISIRQKRVDAQGAVLQQNLENFVCLPLVAMCSFFYFAVLLKLIWRKLSIKCAFYLPEY